MARKNNEQSIKDVINQLFSTYQLQGKVNDAKVIACWEEVMGKTIANHTKQLYVRNGTLFLTIDSAPLKQELFFSKNKIKQILNKKLGMKHIEEVVFR